MGAQLPQTGTEGRQYRSGADFALSTDEERAITVFTAAAAQEVLHFFEADCADDSRPRQAIEAAQAFIDGGPRSRLQRNAAIAAHRSAKQAPSLAGFHAAMAAGDAAASMYLHPLANASQVGHILRAPAHAVLAWEHAGARSPGETAAVLQRIVGRATPTVTAVLSQYPGVPQGENPVATHLASLDAALRNQRQLEGLNTKGAS